MHPLENEVWHHIDQDVQICTGEGTVIGVSGGSDSLALLYLLSAQAKKRGIRLLPVYINHGLRPEESANEEHHVADVCRQLQLPCEIIAVATREYAEDNRYTLEQAARVLRYEAFKRLCVQHGLQWVSVAHTADDQAEEIVLRLLRGSSRKAVAGMLRVQGQLLRPLLHLKKEKLQAYLLEKQVHWCHDSSNDDLYYLRNRIRHHLLPTLEKEYDPGVRNALCKTAENLAQDESLLEVLTDQMWESLLQDAEPDVTQPLVLQRDAFLQFHPCLQRRFVERLLWALHNTAKYEYIVKLIDAALNGRNGSELHLSKGLRVQVQAQTLIFSYPRGRGSWRGSVQQETKKKSCSESKKD